MIEISPQVLAYQDSVAFYLRDRNGVGQPITFSKVPAGSYVDPSFRISTSEAQALFEKMWAQGFRSKHDNGNSDKLDQARREHLADLRAAAKISPRSPA